MSDVIDKSLPMTRQEISRRMGALNSDMLKRRQALNEEHHYPRLKVIQEDCAALGHMKGELRINMVGTHGRYDCGYCGAHVETISFEGESVVTEEQIKHMVDRFLGMRLPDGFNPDGGIRFEAPANPVWWPTGTNVLDATQAEAMVRHMIDGLP